MAAEQDVVMSAAQAQADNVLHQASMMNNHTLTADTALGAESQDVQAAKEDAVILALPRIKPLDVEPDPDEPEWKYTPSNQRRLEGDVLRITSNLSFLSQVVRVITRDGESKGFETITGLDGLTFGVTDFASVGGIYSFFKDFNGHYPRDFQRMFGRLAGNLLNEDWLETENHKKRLNDGLVRLRWVREGLAKLLGRRRFRGFQLAHFVRGKVRARGAALDQFQKYGFTRQFTLAAICAVANSFGGPSVGGHVAHAIKAATGKRGRQMEDSFSRRFLEEYVDKECAKHPKTATILARGFGDEEGPMPGAGDLGHRGRRVRHLFLKFPFAAEDDRFTELGTFVLDKDERFAGDPATA